MSADFLLGLLGAIVLSVVVFVAGGGTALGANTWVQGGLVALAAAVSIAVLLIGAPGRAWGAAALTSFAGLAALTYASIAWSVQPADSWLEGNRTLSYLVAFGAALLLARLAPGRWRAVLGAVASAATVACGYSLLVKVFHGSLDAGDTLGRLRAPFDYWNAVGLMAAIGIPACLWAGARREPAPVLRAASAPAIAILVAALVLSFSRGALLAAVVGVVSWFAMAPLRLRSALVLLVGGAGGAVISAWGIAHRGISSDTASDASRISAGHAFGVVIGVTLVITLLAGVGARVMLDRRGLPAAVRRRLGLGLVGLAALIPVAGVVALAESHRGLTGEVSHLWKTLTNPNGGVGNGARRVVDLSNSRPHYWRVALKVGEHNPLAGVGAAGFATAQTRYGGSSAPTYVAKNAHGYVFETFADLGAIGLAVSLAALLTWLIAAGRTIELSWLSGRTRASRAPPASELSSEGTGLVAMVAIALAFGVHSTIDWTWFIPGVTVVALACAGWVAGRGPLGEPIGRLAHRRVLSRSPRAVGVMTLIVVCTLASLWVIAQPLRASDSASAAITADVGGNAGAALTDARRAAAENPVSVDPLFLLSQLETAVHDNRAARQALTDAVSRQPENPQTWEQLGCYDLRRDLQGPSRYELHRALILDPANTQLQSDPRSFCASF